MVSYLKQKGITLAELLIVVILLSIVIFGVYGVNFMGQLRKANDLKRKEALSKIQKVLENYHTDHDRYPTVDELAYERMTDIDELKGLDAGKVCGSRKTGDPINNYIGELPCEPKSPNEDYVYFVFNNNQKYALFTNLENENDDIISQLGCEYGCSYFLDPNDITGSISHNFFNYYTTSSDFEIEFCYGGTNYTACYPNASHDSDKCRACTDFNCQPGYQTLYCTASWCVQNCN